MKNLLPKVVAVAQKAGDAVMQVYEGGDFDVQQKGDSSPLTKADIASHGVIQEELERLSNHPIVCEEGAHSADGATKFWLVDPLDGTKEFIKRNGEFTVNIALIEAGEPILGVVYAPALDVLYFAALEVGAFKLDHGKKQTIEAKFGSGTPKVVTSRSHKDERTAELLEAIGPHQEISMGSSLKLCLVAEGVAMLYPRLAPTYGWDTAAADAVVRAAGGFVEDLQGRPLKYPPKASKNPYFIVRTKDSIKLDT